MKDGIFLKQMGAKIKAVRVSRGMTLRQLGTMCNLDFGSISRIENGQKNSYLLTIKTIADKLEVDVKEFL
ncbi:XRE family transcriptional regulator [Lacibacter luteus]|uniref:XRE family transcriptional regulator n=1 Tax=Lacibacter luteus TaxID=2508719 RepID=A0A4Q1CEE3_9BACT|nr:helix-turn-helix transcriptional regulator [Lacibacter luteus]RXK58173.1 XRE family transcriptional regulator [Lacibacter luteus]